MQAVIAQFQEKRNGGNDLEFCHYGVKCKQMYFLEPRVIYVFHNKFRLINLKHHQTI